MTNAICAIFLSTHTVVCSPLEPHGRYNHSLLLDLLLLVVVLHIIILLHIPLFFVNITSIHLHYYFLSLTLWWCGVQAPAMYNIIEAVQQLTGRAHGRQIPNAKRALVYANGGIFSASSIAILSI